ncbi:MAG: hypothetical protein PUE85_02510 [Firmicutes bacterium]|nr:hypothetical protein [Bacillota bacterium]
MNKIKRNVCKTIGIGALSFGAGIFLTFFLPLRILILIESAVIITVGFFYISQR